jgi:hypothetical protein
VTRLSLSDSFRREGLAAVLYVALLATLFAQSGSSHVHGAARYRALAAGLIFLGLGAVRTREAVTQRKASKAFKSVGMFVIALTELIPIAGHGAPGWWLVPAVACLALVVGSICLALVLWQRERDERERAIVNAATTIAFFVTMTVVLVFFLLARLNVASITASWVLVTAAASWFAAWFVLQERM